MLSLFLKLVAFLKNPNHSLWIFMRHYNKTKSEIIFLVIGMKLNFEWRKEESTREYKKRTVKITEEKKQ